MHVNYSRARWGRVGARLLTAVPFQSLRQAGQLAHSLVDPVAVLQSGVLPLELLGQVVEVRKPPEQVFVAGLPQLRIIHKALHQV